MDGAEADVHRRGKPIFSFAADSDGLEDKEELTSFRLRLQRRCLSFYFAHFGGVIDDHEMHQCFSGMQGSLVAAAGGGLFLSLGFSWPAAASLIMSVFAFLATTRTNMIAVDCTQSSRSADNLVKGLRGAVPGPAAFVVLLMGMPFWMISLSLWGVSTFANSETDEHLWMWPSSWVGVVSGFEMDRALTWCLLPHYVCNWVGAPVVAVMGALEAGRVLVFLGAAVATLVGVLLLCLLEVLCVGMIWRWYFSRENKTCMRWPAALWERFSAKFLDKDAYYVVVENVQVMLHCVLTAVFCGLKRNDNPVFSALLFVYQVALLGVALFVTSDCAEQEWALASVIVGMSLVVLCAKALRPSKSFFLTRASTSKAWETDLGWGM